MIKPRITPPEELIAIRQFQLDHPTLGPSDGSDHPLSRWEDDPLVHVAGCGCYHTSAGDEITDARCRAKRMASD